MLLGSEPERPYERPPLSKEYLRGETDREQAYVHEAAFYDEHGIELRSGEHVVRLDPGRRELTLQTDEQLGLRPPPSDHGRNAAAAEHPRQRA